MTDEEKQGAEILFEADYDGVTLRISSFEFNEVISLDSYDGENNDIIEMSREMAARVGRVLLRWAGGAEND